MVSLQRAGRAKFVLAVVGGSAVVAMAGFSAATGTGPHPNSVPVAAPVMPGPMTEGDTVTTTIPPSVLATEKAAPLVKAPRYGKG